MQLGGVDLEAAGADSSFRRLDEKTLAGVSGAGAADSFGWCPTNDSDRLPTAQTYCITKCI